MKPVEEAKEVPPPKAAKLSVLGEHTDAAIAAKIDELVRLAKKIIITGHERPDGDCIGSEVALCATLREMGYNATVVNADPTPVRYHFLVEDNMVRQAAENETLDADLVFVLDATDLRRLGRIKPEQFKHAKVVDIDHHLANPNFGEINWVDTRAAATGELIWRLASNCGWRVPPIALQALYAAIVTDTGQFAYGNTSARVMRMAAELIERGVDPEAIWQRIYLNRSANELALEARARASLKCYADGKICVIGLRHEDFVETNTGSQHTEEMAGIPRSLAGVDLALFLYEIEGGARTKASIRTIRNLDACALAQKFGGGGHRQAAGCTINAKLPEAIRQIVAQAEAMIAQQQK